jgi:hypothetical protein
MAMHKECCQLRLGQLYGDARAEAAIEWLSKQGVVRPEKVAQVILPWPA